jgi:uncharacterized protein YbbC (DUF1343 family)
MKRMLTPLLFVLLLVAGASSPSLFSQTVSSPRSTANISDVQYLKVKNGIDVLEEDGFKALHPRPESPKKIGLVTNQTGVDAQGRRTIDVLAIAPGIKLVALFSPEHGAIGALETTNIGNTVDPTTGIPIYSVFGATDESRRPPLDVMKNLDEVVYDIQDVGVRFYTYETTMAYFLEAAAKTGTEFIVLDRPNPINGIDVQGPITDQDQESFVAYGQTPVRHGMTVGELARLYNAERHINARLTVVQMQGWRRDNWFDATGQTWINPSPNMRSLTEAALYPGVCLIERTNVSVGRGTDKPFENFGAPWINPRQLAGYLNARQIPGVRFVPLYFTPTASWYKGQQIGGVFIVLLDRTALDSPAMGIEIASALHKLYPRDFFMESIIAIIGNKSTVDAIKAQQDPRPIAESWLAGLNQFRRVRQKYLLY